MDYRTHTPEIEVGRPVSRWWLLGMIVSNLISGATLLAVAYLCYGAINRIGGENIEALMLALVGGSAAVIQGAVFLPLAIFLGTREGLGRIDRALAFVLPAVTAAATPTLIICGIKYS